MTPTLCVLVPSRGRPEQAAELIRAWGEVTDNATLKFLVDDDDPTLTGYYDLPTSPGISVIVGPRQRIGPTLNVIAVIAAKMYDAVGFMGDDHRPRTSGWDTEMMAVLDKPGIAFGDDLFQSRNLPTAVVMSSKIIQTLGWMVPYGLLHLYLDNSWKALGEAIGALHYLPDVVIEHLHPAAGKAQWDAGYREVNDPAMYDHDRLIFEHWRDFALPADAKRLREVL